MKFKVLSNSKTMNTPFRIIGFSVVFSLAVVFGGFAFANESEKTVNLDDGIYTLSLQSALIFALDESYQLKIAGEQVTQAELAIENAETGYYPSIDVLVEAGREYNNPAAFSDATQSGSNANESLEMTLTLRQMLFDQTVWDEVDRRETLAGAKNIELTLAQEDVLQNTIEAYLNVYKSQQNAYAAAESLLNIREIYDRVSIAYQAGGESKANFDYATARLALAESKYNSAIAGYKDVVARLEVLTGVLPRFVAVQPEELSISDYDLAFYKKIAQQRNNEIILAEQNMTATKFDLNKKESAYLPKLNLVMEAERSYDVGGEIGRVDGASAMLQLSYDIFKGGSRKVATDTVKSKLRELEYEKLDAQKTILKDIRVTYNEIEAIEDSISSKLDEVNAYVSLRNIAKKSADVGEIDLFKNIENEENISTALSDIYNMQSDKFKKSFELLRLIGSLQKNKFCESC